MSGKLAPVTKAVNNGPNRTSVQTKQGARNFFPAPCKSLRYVWIKQFFRCSLQLFLPLQGRIQVLRPPVQPQVQLFSVSA